MDRSTGLGTPSLERIAATILGLLLLVLPAQAQVVRQLTDLRDDRIFTPAIDDAGTIVAVNTNLDPFGTNPRNVFQPLTWELPGGSGAALGGFVKGIAGQVTVTDDGQRLAVLSPSDPLGTNHDASIELFLVLTDGSGVVQLTDDPGPNAGSVQLAMISGSGNRVAFVADTDPVGANPDRVTQLFVVDASTLAITQLTHATDGQFLWVSIDDAGQRIAFDHDADPAGGPWDGQFDVFRVLHDGSNLAQLTDADGNPDILDFVYPRLSGNGKQIACWSFGDPLGNEAIFLVDFQGGNPVQIAAGGPPTITDDAQRVYFGAHDGSNDEIFVVAATGGPWTRVTTTDPPVSNGSPIVSGGNERIAFLRNGALHAMDVDGTDVVQLAPAGSLEGWLHEAELTPDGERVVFSAQGNSGGLDADRLDLWRIETDGSDLTRLTVDAGAYQPSVTADGDTIAFMSYDDLTGQSPWGYPQIFLVQDDGTGLTLLSPPQNQDFYEYPLLSDDGARLAFLSTGWELGNPGGGAELYSMALPGGAMTQFTDDDDSLRKNPQIGGDGDWVAYHSQTDDDGLNPDSGTEVFRARTDGTVVERLTQATGSGSWYPTISADGRRVAFVSTADPVGSNPDHNAEIFLYDAEHSTTQQLTFTTEGQSNRPRISGDGGIVYFLSTSPFFEPNLAGLFDVYRVIVATGGIERAGGLRDPRSALVDSSLRTNPSLMVSFDGSKMAFHGIANPTGENLDFTTDLWLVDYTAQPQIHPGVAAPTLVRWDAEPQGVRYDVIRGDVAELQSGPSNTVDLGAVACLEDDSPDNDTLGFEDPLQPDPGQVLFYLYRASEGASQGPGSWGQGTGGAERVPASGGCS